MKQTRLPTFRTAAAVAALAVLVPIGAVAAPSTAAEAAMPPAGHGPPTDGNDVRAVATYNSMQNHLYLGTAEHGLYRENTDTTVGNPYSYLWEYREAAQAALDLQGMAKLGSAYALTASDRIAGFTNYFAVAPNGSAGYESYVPAPLGTGGDVYYDDNAVVGLSFIGQYRATEDAGYLDDARAAFDIVARGWNPDPTLACPGGMDWIDRPDNTTRGANITGLAAQLAAHLYEETCEQHYLDWSTKLYDWNNTCLKTDTGLYANSIGDDGVVDPTLWTYNSGAMIATATLLYRATGDEAYLRDAKSAAQASLAYWTADGRLAQQPAIFNAFYAKDLFLLDSVSHDPSYRAAVEAYAAAVWTDNRDPETGLFHFQASGGGAYDAARPAATLDQAAMIQIYAALAWDRSELGDIS